MAATTMAPKAPEVDPYEIMRKRAQQQGIAAKQEGGEALKRRFAAMGNVNSGAYIKAAGQQDQAADANTQNAVQQVDAQELQYKAQQQEAQKARDFQGAEAEKGRIFNKDMFDKDQAFKQTVFADESKFRDINAKLAQQDLDMSKAANRLNATSAINTLDDSTLRGLSGLGSGWNNSREDLITMALRKYGYG